VRYSLGIVLGEGAMPNLFFVDSSDKGHILRHIRETLSLMEYPTPIVFSMISRLAIVSFLRGKGVLADAIDAQAIDVFKQLSCFASQDDEYWWFEEWSQKLISAVKERQIGVV